ncbi:hypothetical protein GGS21DRAFT_64684 [Xylaria nigripes]|nr:hypothetical protein GGS21DRAFT_64684 [Xylaria nigripes]
MAMWPFRRMGSRRRSRTALCKKNSRLEAGVGDEQFQAPPPHTQIQPASVQSNVACTGDAIKIPQRLGRTYSFSPGRQDSLRINGPREKSSVVGHELPPDHDDCQRAPTLHHGSSKNKRSGQPLLRKKSSKRRKEDHDREAEIRAMSYIMPARPTTDAWNALRPVKKDSRQSRTDRGHLPSKMPPRSLESIHSAVSSDSEQIAWEVSAFSALSPRPTLRFSSNPLASPQAGSELMRPQSVRKMIAGPIPESMLRAHRRVNDLVDDLDASDLRELLERDQRRRQRKKEEDRARAERRLARRVEKQRAEEAAAAKNGLPPPANLERGVLGREMPESSAEGTSAVITSSRRRSSSNSSDRQSKPSSKDEEAATNRKTPSPLNDFHRTESLSLPESSSTTKVVESSVPVKQVEFPASSSSTSLFSLMRSKKRRSDSPAQSEQPTQATVLSQPTSSIKLDDAESVSRTSDSRTSRHWLSIFRWGKTQRASGPSSFSNTSRDSMSGSHPTPIINSISLRKASNGARRPATSRFREDLPELPISPPDSRVASPEAESIPNEPLPPIPDDVAMRYDTPIEAHQHDVVRASPISIHRDETQSSPTLQAMSLASIGSEASWLSGRISRKQASLRMRSSLHSPRTVSALSGRSDGRTPEHNEEDNILDDEDIDNMVPGRTYKLATGETRPSSGEDEDSSMKWGAVGQTPTIRQHRDTMRSREGVIQFFENEDENERNSSEANYNDDRDGQGSVYHQRAPSDEHSKGHFRSLSAESAKVLEVSSRSSSGRRRSAMEQGTR